jgi:hypothetical protein
MLKTQLLLETLARMTRFANPLGGSTACTVDRRIARVDVDVFLF